MPELKLNYKLLPDDMCDLSWNKDEVPNIRYSVNGADITGRNRLYSEPFWVGYCEVLTAKGYDEDLNPITDQVEINFSDTTKSDPEVESVYDESAASVEVTETKVIDEVSTIEIPVESGELEDVVIEDTEEYIDKVDKELKSEYETEPKVKEESINQAIEDSKPNYVKVIYKPQFNSYHVVVYRNFMTEEDNYFYSSPIDVLNKIKQFNPSTVRINIDKFATHFVKEELLDKGYVVNYV